MRPFWSRLRGFPAAAATCFPICILIGTSQPGRLNALLKPTSQVKRMHAPTCPLLSGATGAERQLGRTACRHPARAVSRSSSRCASQLHSQSVTDQRCPHAAKALALLALAQAAGPAHAEQLVAQVSEGSATLPFAVGGVSALAALSAAFIAADPEKRRKKQTKAAGGDEKAAVRSYFNTQGFDRWSKIYSQSDEVSKVQRDIRDGHGQTVEKVLQLLDKDGVKGKTICDAGCGTGSLAIPLAIRGAAVSASDISDSMADEARRRYEAALAEGGTAPSTAPTFEGTDLESLHGKWDTVSCLDVLIHYDQNSVDGMIRHLASLSDRQLILSFAPKTLYYSVLKRIGEFFPGPSRATRAYLHAEADIEAALSKAGFKVVQKDMTATSFYFSRLFQAVRQ